MNLIVQDDIKEIRIIIEKIRKLVLFIKRPPSRLHKFDDIESHIGLSTAKALCIDVLICWNFTYQMLEPAFYFRVIFS